jgi:hypothetical protein
LGNALSADVIGYLEEVPVYSIDIGLFLRRQDIGDLTFMRRELTPLLRPDERCALQAR